MASRVNHHQTDLHNSNIDTIRDEESPKKNLNRGPLKGMMSHLLNRNNGVSSSGPAQRSSTTNRLPSPDFHIMVSPDPPSRQRRTSSLEHYPISPCSPSASENLTSNLNFMQNSPSLQNTTDNNNMVLSAEFVAGAVPPLGLSGPTSFKFAPSSQGRYLAFLSSNYNQMHSTSPGHKFSRYTQQSSIVRSGVKLGMGNGERQLFVVDLEPFRKHLTQEMDDQNQIMSSSPSTDSFSFIPPPITNPQLVMNNTAVPLLNTSLPLSRNSSKNNLSNHYHHMSNISPKNNSPNNIKSDSESSISLEEQLRRERQRMPSNGITQFIWKTITINDMNHDEESKSLTKPPNNYDKTMRPSPERLSSSQNINSKLRIQRKSSSSETVRILVPLRGNIYIQDGVSQNATSPLRLLYDKNMLENTLCTNDTYNDNTKSPKKSSHEPSRSRGSVVGRDTGAIDPQLSPDGSMVAFVVAGDIYVMRCHPSDNDDEDLSNMNMRQDYDVSCDTDRMDVEWNEDRPVPIRLTFGAVIDDEYDSSSLSSDNHDNAMDESLLNHQDKDRKRYGTSITLGLADFVAQEEMDRYRGFWWDTESKGILFTRVDESYIPPYRITHQGKDGSEEDEPMYEDHRYPFAGESNPNVILGYIPIDRSTILGKHDDSEEWYCEEGKNVSYTEKLFISGCESWSKVKWFHPPPEASEYLARVNWLPDGTVCVQWQDRSQLVLVLVKLDIFTGESIILHEEICDTWINLHHMFHVLPRAVHPEEIFDSTKQSNSQSFFKLPYGSFSFLFASERTGYSHLYLYTYIPGNKSATLVRAVTAGEWIVESICGVDMDKNLVYFTGTYDSVLERHLYVVPLINNDYNIDQQSLEKSNNGGMRARRSLKQVMNSISGSASKNNPNEIDSHKVLTFTPTTPIRLTNDEGMHSIVMDESCQYIVDTSSNLNRPTSTKVFWIPSSGPFVSSDDGHLTPSIKLLFVPYDASFEIRDIVDLNPISISGYPAPEIISFQTSDGSETLYAALYRPDPSVYGDGPYPLICAVYGGPHVQRVNRSWCQSADMRVQRLCSMGFAVIKCDNRGSSRRGLAFEGSIKHRLGRIEVLDQVAAVRQAVLKGVADPSRVGIYGWSYGGYLAAMCLCRAPDVFHVAIAGAPVTSWDGYDTHYTERYMGLPSDNPEGYHEAAVFDHTPNMRGKLMIIHGLIDENVHFRHTSRLINRLIAAGKDYDLLIFPDERHSPRRLRDRVYMEKRMSDYFIKHLLVGKEQNSMRQFHNHNVEGMNRSPTSTGIRSNPGHL